MPFPFKEGRQRSPDEMKRSQWRVFMPFLFLSASTFACGESVPTKPVNRRPVILALIAFPTAIGPGDSTIVTCTATGRRLRYARI